MTKTVENSAVRGVQYPRDTRLGPVSINSRYHFLGLVSLWGGQYSMDGHLFIGVTISLYLEGVRLVRGQGSKCLAAFHAPSSQLMHSGICSKPFLRLLILENRTDYSCIGITRSRSVRTAHCHCEATKAIHEYFN
jgi:hypothetical protein